MCTQDLQTRAVMLCVCCRVCTIWWAGLGPSSLPVCSSQIVVFEGVPGCSHSHSAQQGRSWAGALHPAGWDTQRHSTSELQALHQTGCSFSTAKMGICCRCLGDVACASKEKEKSLCLFTQVLVCPRRREPDSPFPLKLVLRWSIPGAMPCLLTTFYHFCVSPSCSFSPWASGL